MTVSHIDTSGKRRQSAPVWRKLLGAGLLWGLAATAAHAVGVRQFSPQGDVSNVGDLGEEGVDHDDNVIIFLRPNTRRLSRFPVVAAKIHKFSNCCKNDKESQKIRRINAKTFDSVDIASP